MGTVAGKCTTRGAAGGHVVRVAFVLALCADLACATAWFAPPCQAQSTAPQNNATPPATTDDPPPSLIKHPKPGPPPQPTAASAPQSGSTPAPQPAATSSASPASVAPVSDAAASAPEINTRTTTVPLESRVNLVPVRVVVHDSTGRAVENLHKEDFQIKQDGQLQFITHFSTEMAGSTDNQVARGEAIPLPTDGASATVTASAPDASGKPAVAP